MCRWCCHSDAEGTPPDCCRTRRAAQCEMRSQFPYHANDHAQSLLFAHCNCGLLNHLVRSCRRANVQVRREWPRHLPAGSMSVWRGSPASHDSGSECCREKAPRGRAGRSRAPSASNATPRRQATKGSRSISLRCWVPTKRVMGSILLQKPAERTNYASTVRPQRAPGARVRGARRAFPRLQLHRCRRAVPSM